uniref:Uncharacterized protein n=1 Tax=viral metagenome TaxID=1070528 RepID=A0A6M3X641_9ZZZZ
MNEEKQEYVTREEYEKLKKRLEEVEAKCETAGLEKVIEATKPRTAVAEAVEKEETEEAETEQETEISQEET